MINWNILTPGDIIDNVSTYNGQQYYITLSIKKVKEIFFHLIFLIILFDNTEFWYHLLEIDEIVISIIWHTSKMVKCGKFLRNMCFFCFSLLFF